MRLFLWAQYLCPYVQVCVYLDVSFTMLQIGDVIFTSKEELGSLMIYVKLGEERAQRASGI